MARYKTNPLSGALQPPPGHADGILNARHPMSWQYIQMETIARQHHDDLIRQADMERLAKQLRPTRTDTQPQKTQPRRVFASLWPRLASQLS
jgi:hypothetical protein